MVFQQADRGFFDFWEGSLDFLIRRLILTVFPVHRRHDRFRLPHRFPIDHNSINVLAQLHYPLCESADSAFRLHN